MGVPHSLGNLAWGCQILGGAKSPVTPEQTFKYWWPKRMECFNYNAAVDYSCSCRLLMQL